MSRKRRVILPGFYYHIMMRGNGGQLIFRDAADRTRFCLLLQYAKEVHDFRVHGFCLMGNHVHLLIQPNTLNLSAGMHALGFRYAQHFNKKYSLRGHLFQGRFKAIVVEEGVYLRRLIRYIHRNPLRAQLAQQASEYTWSSHASYLGLDQSYCGWLETDPVLCLFQGTQPMLEGEETRIASFADYVDADDEDAKEHLRVIRQSHSWGAYGSPQFIERYGDPEPGDYDLYLLSEAKHRGEIELEDVIEITCGLLEVPRQELDGATRHPRVTDARAIAAVVATRSRMSTLSEIAALMSRDHSSLSRLKRKALERQDLCDVADQVQGQLLSRARILQ